MSNLTSEDDKVNESSLLDPIKIWNVCICCCYTLSDGLRKRGARCKKSKGGLCTTTPRGTRTEILKLEWPYSR